MVSGAGQEHPSPGPMPGKLWSGQGVSCFSKGSTSMLDSQLAWGKTRGLMAEEGTPSPHWSYYLRQGPSVAVPLVYSGWGG